MSKCFPHFSTRRWWPTHFLIICGWTTNQSVPGTTPWGARWVPKMSMASLGAARRIRVGALTAWLEMILTCTKWGYHGIPIKLQFEWGKRVISRGIWGVSYFQINTENMIMLQNLYKWWFPLFWSYTYMLSKGFKVYHRQATPTNAWNWNHCAENGAETIPSSAISSQPRRPFWMGSSSKKRPGKGLGGWGEIGGTKVIEQHDWRWFWNTGWMLAVGE